MKDVDPRTRCARSTPGRPDFGWPLAPAIVPSSTFVFDDQAAVDRFYEDGRGYLYSRYANPTVTPAERLLADLEGAGDAALFSSGMAAIASTLMAFAGAGDRVAAQAELYGGTDTLLRDHLPAQGVTVERLDHEAVAALEPGQLEGCKLLYLETPTNPSLRLVDLTRACRVASRAGVPVAVDSTFATPILQRPLEAGVEVVLHSATKYLGGHGDLIAGAAAGSAGTIARIKAKRRFLGSTLDPFGAFLLHRGLRTLAVRMAAHGEGAAVVAGFLRSDRRVERVMYPGLEDHPDHDLASRQMDGYGGMVSFTVRGDGDAAARVHDALGLFVRTGSLGSVESLVSIPARMSHRGVDPAERRRLGITDNLLRLSVGLESPSDLVADLDQALDASLG